MKRYGIGILVVLTLFPLPGFGVQWSTLTDRPRLECSIYRSADLSLVREFRTLTLSRGTNRLRFDWREDRIDPTSLRLRIREPTGRYRVNGSSFPPDTRRTVVWTVQADRSGTVPVEISYFTLGLDWEALYRGQLPPREQQLHLNGYVRLINRTAEDYEHARFRLVVGKVPLLEQLSKIIQEWHQKRRKSPSPGSRQGEPAAEALHDKARDMMVAEAQAPPAARRQSVPSEFSIIRLPGTRRLRSGWTRRVLFMEADSVPVGSLYRYDAERYGREVQRFFTFTNNTESGLGTGPLPEGSLQLIRNGHDRIPSFVGETRVPHLAVGEPARVPVGTTRKVSVSPVLMDRRSRNFEFDPGGDLVGWEEIEQRRVVIRNRRSIPVSLQYYRSFPDDRWSILNASHPYARETYNRVRFDFTLNADERVTLRETVRLMRGRSQE